MKGLSYVQKTVFPYLFLLAASLIAIGISTSNYFEGFVLSNWEKELIAEATLFSEQLAPDFATLDPSDNLSSEAIHFLDITGNRTTLIALDGTVVGESDYAISEMENHLLRPEVQSALRGETQAQVRLSTTMHQRYIYIAVPVYQDQTIVGIVRLAKSLAEYDAAISKFRFLLYLVAGASFIFSTLFMLLQSAKKFNPLRKISEQIYTSSKGNIEIITGKERKDEIGLVVSAHNDQVEKIKLQFQTMENERIKLTAILFNMTDGVILVGANGSVTMINPAAERLFSSNLEGVQGDSLTEVVRQYQIVELWKLTRQTGKTQSTIIQTSMERENIQVIASLLGPMLPGEVLLLFQDLTLLRKLETVRKDFVSNISHELRTPLASLKALTETLQNGALQDPQVSSHFLDQMNDEIDNMTQIVQELLELAKIESGKVPVEKKKYPIDEIISRPVERMRLQAERSGISIEINETGKLPLLNVDLMRIQQVFINLIHNAIKFTPPGGKITISAKRNENKMVFTIADTGAGIAPKDVERIFERFYKTDRSRSSGGTGLGLSISKHIIEAHGGEIWVDSIQGQGSTFSFLIPIN
jgi:two-component system, OmpR family, phosphate regulon sensor histidine kinase PhoR